MSELRLYTYWRSSACYRIRIALNLKGLAYESEPVHLAKGEQHSAAFSEVNPQELIPVLRHGDRVLRQSLAIMEYLDETFPERPLLPAVGRDRQRARAIANLIACDIHPVNNLRILKYLKREMNQPQEAIDAWYRHWCTEGLSAYEREIGAAEPGGFSHGMQATMADICLVPQIFNAQRFEVDMKQFPKTMAVFERCMALPAFDAAQPSRQAEASRAPG